MGPQKQNFAEKKNADLHKKKSLNIKKQKKYMMMMVGGPRMP
jgi:hypothetical protein